MRGIMREIQEPMYKGFLEIELKIFVPDPIKLNSLAGGSDISVYV